MLHDFITRNRDELIARTRRMVAVRRAPRPTDHEIQNGIPLFLDQLAGALRLEQPGSDEMDKSASQHGGDLLRHGFTVAQVVHDYGDVCQAVTELAAETNAAIGNDEFQTLNKCLDNAIAQAVTAFTHTADRRRSTSERERLGIFAHELRNKLSATTLAFEAMKGGRVGVAGSTGSMIDRNLRALRDLIDRELAEVRLDAGSHFLVRVPVKELLEEVEVDASVEAKDRGIVLNIEPTVGSVEIDVDRPIVLSALINILHNALKFTRHGGAVSMTTSATAGRVRFCIEDECGGLPEGKVDELFGTYVQRNKNREGLGLGLHIAKRGIEANGGRISAQNLPGKGCIFTVELPRAGSRATDHSAALTGAAAQ